MVSLKSSGLCLTLGLALSAGCTLAPAAAPPPRPARAYHEVSDPAAWPSPRCRTWAHQMVAAMDLAEKVGQMAMSARARTGYADVSKYRVGAMLSGGGSAPPYSNEAPAWLQMVQKYQSFTRQTRLQIPILYGIDAVHGHGNVRNATIFPHNIGLGCSRNPDLVARVARATAVEVAATGMRWTFSPVLAAARDERWGRTYEAFGEDPELAALLGRAAIRGYQGGDRLVPGPSNILACAKHFAGDGGTAGGRDRGNTPGDEASFRRLHVDQYHPAIAAGAASVMVSYSSYREVPLHAHRHLLTDVLRQELGFDGIVLSDWEGIDKLPGTYCTQLANGINAGIDMVMAPPRLGKFVSTIKSLVPERVPSWRIDDAVTRILSVKCEAGFVDSRAQLQPGLNAVGSVRHRALAREAVRKTVVLLKNERNVLPLQRGKRYLLAGKNADNIGSQCGGWTITWQGGREIQTQGTTLRAAMEAANGIGNLQYSVDGSGAQAVRGAVVVIGETPYAELKGDRDDLSLDPEDVAAVANAKAAGLPVAVVLITGRPLILQPILNQADAILVAWLPGTEGQGVTDVLFGDHPPTGKLSHSWPRSMGQIPINQGDTRYDPLFAYGHGLSYD